MRFIVGLFRLLATFAFYVATVATIGLIGLRLSGNLALPDGPVEYYGLAAIALFALYLLKRALDDAVLRRHVHRLEDTMQAVVRMLLDQNETDEPIGLGLITVKMANLADADRLVLEQLASIEGAIESYEASPLGQEMRTEIEDRLTTATARVDAILAEAAANPIDATSISAAVTVLGNRLDSESDSADSVRKALKSLAELEERLAKIAPEGLEAETLLTRLTSVKEGIVLLKKLQYPFGEDEYDLEDQLSTLESDLEDLKDFDLEEKITSLTDINEQVKRLVSELSKSFKLLQRLELTETE